jgi:N-methylhydantoinase A
VRFAAGVDVGGTFTDLVGWDADSGRLQSLKVPTTPHQPAEGVLAGLAALAPEMGTPRSLAHGTTMVTNAVVERRGAVVGLVSTRGFRDVLEIGRMNRRHLYRLDIPAKPDPLVPRRLRLEITERVGPDGTILAPLVVEEIPGLIAGLREGGAEAVAVCLLHAYANPAHERTLREALAPHFACVTISSEVNAEFREFERTSTTVLNASVTPLAAQYIADLDGALRANYGALTLHLLQSNGGMMSVEAARRRALAMAASGPAAGVAAASDLARRLGLPRALAFDMGGTTTDVCLIADGRAETSAQRRLGDFPVRLPMVAVESIGAGGGSLAWTDAAEALKVGPRSAGAVPGPACYGLGGTEPTVTDANLLLGYLNPERIYGGRIRLDPGRARTAVARLAAQLGLALLDSAHGIVEVANANMQRALRLVSVQRGYDLRQFALIAYGGAGPIHAGRLAAELGIPRVIVPAHSGAFSALGCLVSELRYDAVRTHRARLEECDAKRLGDRFQELEEQCLTPLLAEGYPPAAVQIVRSLDLRYSGQNYEIEVPFDAREPAALRLTFETRHRQLYGYATGENVECVNLRLTASVPRAGGELPSHTPTGPSEPVGTLRAYFPETASVDMPRYDREGLGEHTEIAGPALVEDAWSTTVVYPGQRCRPDRWGNLQVEVGRL